MEVSLTKEKVKKFFRLIKAGQMKEIQSFFENECQWNGVSRPSTICAQLLQKVDHENSNAFHLAAANGRAEVLRFLLQHFKEFVDNEQNSRKSRVSKDGDSAFILPSLDVRIRNS